MTTDFATAQHDADRWQAAFRLVAARISLGVDLWEHGDYIIVTQHGPTGQVLTHAEAMLLKDALLAAGKQAGGFGTSPANSPAS